MGVFVDETGSRVRYRIDHESWLGRDRLRAGHHSARDPETGTIKVFPHPCDVPEGWEVIQNDVPGL